MVRLRFSAQQARSTPTPQSRQQLSDITKELHVKLLCLTRWGTATGAVSQVYQHFLLIVAWLRLIVSIFKSDSSFYSTAKTLLEWSGSALLRFQLAFITDVHEQLIEPNLLWAESHGGRLLHQMFGQYASVELFCQASIHFARRGQFPFFPHLV